MSRICWRLTGKLIIRSVSTIQFACFETALGTGAIAWTEQGVCGVELPEPDPARLRARFLRRLRGASESEPPAWILEVTRRIVALLQGESVDLSWVTLDLDRVAPFERRVYAVTRTIPAGQTMSYGQIARQLGDVRLARDVGQALAHNPCPIIVPCHRVIATGGKLGGFSARGGVGTKQRLLQIERANVAWQLPLGA
jgi:methylated-DNA-[protein]-cysteine S-methyltransferase